MSGTEQDYFEMLSRTDHPVFFKDFAPVQTYNSPLNSIENRVMADQLVRMRAVMDEFQLNLVPDTVTAMTIADWETEYFGFTKPSLGLAQRVAELLIKFNKRLSMAYPDALALAQSIVGQTPQIVRNVSRSGWVLGQGALGVSTILDSPGSSSGTGLYLVNFTTPVPSNLLTQLDTALTRIEKAGSRHVVKAPIQYWVLGRTALGINTALGVG